MKQFALFVVCLVAASSSAQIIPASRVVDWTPGSTVGVPGGIPNYTNIIDVTTLGADNTGVTNVVGIVQSAVNSAPDKSVIYFPAGTYLWNGAVLMDVNHNHHGIALRGAGPANTVLMSVGNGSDMITVGVNSSSWIFPQPNIQVTNGLTKGSTNIMVTDSSGFVTNQIAELNMYNDPNLPVISTLGYDLQVNTSYSPAQQALRWQKLMITKIVGNTITFWPPLYADYSAVTNYLTQDGWDQHFCGIESMFLECSNLSVGSHAIDFYVGYGCWMTNVTVHNPPTYGVFVSDCLNWQAEHCTFDSLLHQGNNGAMVIMGATDGFLFENNIFLNAFPLIMLQGSHGGAAAFNFFQNPGGAQCTLWNHTKHGGFNLAMGNCANTWENDDNDGSSGDDTYIWNWFNGEYSSGNGLKTPIKYLFMLKRFCYRNNLVGNVIGYPGATKTADVHNPDATEFGSPAIGQIGGAEGTNVGLAPPWSLTVTNGSGTMSISGTTATTTVPFFTPTEVFNVGTNWRVNIEGHIPAITAYISSTQVTLESGPGNGSGFHYKLTPDTGGYLEHDTNVLFTLIRKANWNFADNGIPAGESVGSTNIPDYLYGGVKPAWWGGIAYPGYSPSNVANLSYTNIPAGYRFVYGVDPATTDPFILTQPQNQTVTAPTTASFSVLAGGNSSLSYQWKTNGASISGATQSSYTTPATTGTMNGLSFTVVVTDTASNAVSSAAILTVNTSTSPSISVQPANQTVNQGQNGTFSVTASGTAPLSYQWTFGGGNISSATASSYTVTSAQSANAGTYAVVVTNVAGSVTSANANLTVNIPPSISVQPADRSVNAGQSVSFWVTASGTAPLAYQWAFDGGNISSATQSAYTLSNAQTNNAGVYVVTITDVAGSLASSAAVLTVTPTNSPPPPPPPPLPPTNRAVFIRQ